MRLTLRATWKHVNRVARQAGAAPADTLRRWVTQALASWLSGRGVQHGPQLLDHHV